MPAKLEKHPGGRGPSLNLVPVFVATIALLLAGGIYAAVSLDDLPTHTAQSSASYSLVGHRAFTALLEELGYQIFVSRTNKFLVMKMPPVLYLSPDPESAEQFLMHPLEEDIDDILAADGTVCLVCRKWQTIPMMDKREWVWQRELLPLPQISDFLDKLGLEAEITRLKVANTQVWQFFPTKSGATLQGTSLQLFQKVSSKVGDTIEPIMTCDQGWLAVRCHLEKGKLIIVSEPDIFTNGGLTLADNSLIAVRLIRYLSLENKLVVDEVAHGLGQDTSLLKLMFSYPYLLVTMQAILLGLAMLLSASRPFAPILPEPRIERSRQQQIQCIARMTYAGGHHRHLLLKYCKNSVRQLQERYPGVSRLEFGQQLEYLDQIAHGKGIAISSRALYQQAQQAQHPGEIMKILWKWHHYQQLLVA